MRRITLILAVAIVAALVVFPGVASANYKIHGGFTNDTDACAGCHRAHTSVSSVTWSDFDGSGNTHSALLVSDATEMYAFCYACHGTGAQGAQTDVESGIFNGSVEGSMGAPLNGGFAGDTNFAGMSKTSDHIIEGGWGAYGGGYAKEGTGTADGFGDPDALFPSDIGWGNQIPMTCASCHDPHGSSNYRILADRVNGNAVGGYLTDSEPTPYVVSVEQGYPNGTVGDGTIGWKKHQPGQDQMVGGNGWPGYVPNYTTEQYALPPTSTASLASPDVQKGMSGWCSGCHSVYMQTGAPHSYETSYAAGDGWGFRSRHRHPMNVTLASGDGALAVTITPAAVPLPLDHDPLTETGPSYVATNTGGDFLECLTCHVAHGTSVSMEGYANVDSAQLIAPDTGNQVVNGILKQGVAPTGDSALLRLDNRGVCEVCHNK